MINAATCAITMLCGLMAASLSKYRTCSRLGLNDKLFFCLLICSLISVLGVLCVLSIDRGVFSWGELMLLVAGFSCGLDLRIPLGAFIGSILGLGLGFLF